MKKGAVFAWIATAFAIIAGFFLDRTIVGGISLLRNNIADNFFLAVTYISSEIIIFAFITALFLWKDKKRRWILPLWITLGVSAITGFLLKATIQRARPFQLGIISLLPQLQEASYELWNFSFPSNHAMLAFCAVPILSQEYPKLKKVWIALAVVIALSRIYLGLHFLSDVIAGGAIGYLIGAMLVHLEKEHKYGKRVYEMVFEKLKRNKVKRMTNPPKSQKKSKRKK
jgi:undecaprenyl-diphosphatase